MSTTLKRAVVLDGVLLPEGTKLTEDQAARVTNPKAYAEPGDHTGPDAHDAREFLQAQAEAGSKGAKKADDKADDSTEQDPDGGAAAGARLARGGKTAAAPKAAN